MKKIIVLLVLSVILTQGAFAGESDNFFVGTWALFLENENAGWLEVIQEDGYLDSQLLWRWGSVTPSAGTIMNGDKLIVTRVHSIDREKDADGKVIKTHQLTSWFEFEKAGKNLIMGRGLTPNYAGSGFEEIAFIGKRLPADLPRPDLKKLKYGKKVKLFNGKDLSGWRLLNEDNINGWSVENGELVNHPVQKEGEAHVHYGNIRTDAEFSDFNLSLEVNIPEGSNSGIYLRGIYEIQVYDSYGKERDSHHLGALYSRITPLVAAEKPAGEWQTLDITLCDRHVNVILNGKTIIDNQPVKGITGGALTANEFAPGPIYLQGDHGAVRYRNMVLKPVKKVEN